MLNSSMMHLDIKTLTALLYLLEERNVGRVANKLYLSQPAMSRTLSRLREAFDDPLFIRTHKEMLPTAKALALEMPLRQILEQMNGLSNDQEFVPHKSERVFRLQTSHYQAQAYMPTIAERFYQMAPNASLETSLVTENSLLRSENQTVDAVLCSEYVQLPSRFESKILGRERFGCIMAKDHPLAGQPTISLDEFLSYNHVLVTLGGSSQIYSESALGDRAKDRRYTLRTPYFMSALEAVGKTDLLFSTSQLLAYRFQEQFGLVIKPLPYDFPPIDYCLSWPSEQSQDPGGMWLRNLCTNVVQSMIPYPVVS
ncbi:LysR family transcriptional regulator [Marinomonas communis]|uniref:DNA-binding transcriptional LysR family regulator n=1 Tax=Marinomonas communis TaxID=28254 RepID=A0A4R6X2C2_9GAMM|nr:LysR family transcriptional regulator [Marinomonas communis]TDR06179.1 DNA-binding transcriptional LysR family regulator [Marinomonas communis]